MGMAVKNKISYLIVCIMINFSVFGQMSNSVNNDDLYGIVPLGNQKKIPRYPSMEGSIDLTSEIWIDIFRSHIDSKSSSGWETICVYWEFNKDGTFRETATQGLGGYGGGEILISGKYKFEPNHNLLFLKIEKSGIKSSSKKKGSTNYLPTEWVDYEKPIEMVLRVTLIKPSQKYNAVFKFDICEGADWNTSIEYVKKCKTFTQGIMGKEP